MKKIKLKLDIIKNSSDARNPDIQPNQRHTSCKSMVLNEIPKEDYDLKHSEGDSVENISFQQTSPMIEFPEPNKVNSRLSELPFKHPLTHKTSKQIEINKGDFMEDTNTALKNIIAEANHSTSQYSSANVGENIEANFTPVPATREIRSIKDTSNSKSESQSKGELTIKELDENEIMMKLQQNKIDDLEKRNLELEGKIGTFEEKYNGLQSLLSSKKQNNQCEDLYKELGMKEEVKEVDNTIQSYTSNATEQDQSNIVLFDQTKPEEVTDCKALKKLIIEKDKQIASYKEFISKLKESLVRILNTHNVKSKAVEEVTKSQINFITKNYTAI